MSTPPGTYSMFESPRGWKMPFSILTALATYREKYGEPSILLVNPADVPDADIPGVEVIPVTFIPKGVLYLGVRIA